MDEFAALDSGEDAPTGAGPEFAEMGTVDPGKRRRDRYPARLADWARLQVPCSDRWPCNSPFYQFDGMAPY